MEDNGSSTIRMYEMNKQDLVVGWVAEIPDIHKFIIVAKPNDRFSYYIGQDLSDSIMSRKVATMIYDYAVKGIVYLVRKRYKNDRSLFEYIAIKASSPPNKKLVPLALVIGVSGNGTQRAGTVDRFIARNAERRNAGLSTANG
jgi:hypothetical protein